MKADKFDVRIGSADRDRHEKLNTHHFSNGAVSPFPGLVCDRCGQWDKWTPQRADTKTVSQVWVCSCGRETLMTITAGGK